MNFHQSQTFPVIDREVALQRLGGDTALFDTLAGFFLEDAPVLMQKLHDAHRSGAAEVMAHAAHSLKGLAATFEATPFRQIAAEIESLARRGDLSRMDSLQMQIDIEFSRLVTSLRPVTA